MFSVKLFVQSISKEIGKMIYHDHVNSLLPSWFDFMQRHLKLLYKVYRLVTNFQTWESWAIVQQFAIFNWEK